MKDETDRSPIGRLLDALDHISEAQAMLELLFMAGGGLHSDGDPSGGAVAYGANTAKEVLGKALGLLNSLKGSFDTPQCAAKVVVMPDPISGWLNEWRRVYAECNAISSDDPRHPPMWQRLSDLEGLIAETPAATASGALAKLEWVIATTGAGNFVEPLQEPAVLRTIDFLRGQAAQVGPFPETRLGRLAFVAEALGIPAPEGQAPDLLGDDAAPHPAVMAFCRETGASLDFIFRGDIRPMVRGDFNRTREGSAAMKGEAA